MNVANNMRASSPATRTSQPPRQHPGGAHPDERRQLSPAALEQQEHEHHRAGDRDGNASPELEEGRCHALAADAAPAERGT